jgi:hypothetical protein
MHGVRGGGVRARLQAGAARLAAVAVTGTRALHAVGGARRRRRRGRARAQLQAVVLERPPHAVPPCAAAAVVVCVRVFVLSPHALLVHALCTQLTGPGAEGGGDHHTRRPGEQLFRTASSAARFDAAGCDSPAARETRVLLERRMAAMMGGECGLLPPPARAARTPPAASPTPCWAAACAQRAAASRAPHPATWARARPSRRRRQLDRAAQVGERLAHARQGDDDEQVHVALPSSPQSSSPNQSSSSSSSAAAWPYLGNDPRSCRRTGLTRFAISIYTHF